MTPTDPLHDAIAAIRRQDFQEAVDLLSSATANPEHSPQTKARATSLRAQAHLLLGHIQEALVDWRAAWGQVRELKDDAGEKALRGLRKEIAQAKAQRDHTNAQKAKSRAVLDTPSPPGSEAPSEENLNLLLERANAHFDCDDPQEGVRQALRLLEICDTSLPLVRFQVLGRLCLLRGQPERASELLELCRDLADSANEPQLVGAVARAAKALGHDFSPHVF